MSRKQSVIPAEKQSSLWIVIDKEDGYVYDQCSTRAAARAVKREVGGLAGNVTILRAVVVAEIR